MKPNQAPKKPAPSPEGIAARSQTISMILQKFNEHSAVMRRALDEAGCSSSFDVWLACLRDYLVSNPRLIDYAAQNPEAIFKAAGRAARDGLLLDDVQASLFERTDPETGLLKYEYGMRFAGKMCKINRTGQVKQITAEVVYENDDFNYSLGDNVGISHTMCLTNRGNRIGAYSIFLMTDGTRVRSWVPASQMEARAKLAGRDSAWNGEFSDEMWINAAIDRGLKRAPIAMLKRLSEDSLFEYDPAPDLAPPRAIDNVVSIHAPARVSPAETAERSPPAPVDQKTPGARPATPADSPSSGLDGPDFFMDF